MNIILSSSNSQPIYEQIVTQIKAMIMSGELKPKDPLPSIRGLAKSLHVSVITAQHAYEDLQRDGFIETVGRQRNLCGRSESGFYPGGTSPYSRKKADGGSQYRERISHFLRPDDPDLQMFYEEE